jgi:hypothetical protein
VLNAEGEVTVGDVTFDATEAMARFERAGLLAAESWRSGHVWVVNVAGPRAPLRAEAGTREEAWRRALAHAEQAGLFDPPPEAEG